MSGKLYDSEPGFFTLPEPTGVHKQMMEEWERITSETERALSVRLQTRGPKWKALLAKYRPALEAEDAERERQEAVDLAAFKKRLRSLPDA